MQDKDKDTNRNRMLGYAKRGFEAFNRGGPGIASDGKPVPAFDEGKWVAATDAIVSDVIAETARLLKMGLPQDQVEAKLREHFSGSTAPAVTRSGNVG